MKADSKMGLRNAGDFLNRLRRKYTKCQTEEGQPLHHSKTFMEQQSLELYEQPNNIADHQPKYQKDSSQSQQLPQQLSQIKSDRPQSSTFCDRLILINLQTTLATYNEDLKILIDNRDCLEEQIEALSEKIKKLSELEENNQVLANENEKSRLYLNELIQEYHKSNQALFKSKLSQQELYNAHRQKLRKVLKEINHDHYYKGFVNHWNRHVLQTIQDRKALTIHIANQKKRTGGETRKEEAVKVEKIEVIPKDVREIEDQFLSPDEPKPKKKLTEKEKAALLGDLKSFSKNFKLPPG